MFGYLLAVLVVVVALWWLWRLLGAFSNSITRGSDLFVARRSFTYTRTRCPVCGELLTGLEVTAIREGRGRCRRVGCPYERREW